MAGVELSTPDAKSILEDARCRLEALLRDLVLLGHTRHSSVLTNCSSALHDVQRLIDHAPFKRSLSEADDEERSKAVPV